MSEERLGAIPDCPVLLRATGQAERILQEYAWIQEHLEGARIIRRRWVERAGLPLECLTIHLGQDDFRHLYFRVEPGIPEHPALGLSMETAIPVGSVAEEYQWLRRVFPGFESLGQELLQAPFGPRDVLTLRLPGGETARIWFDISAFFGH